MLTKFDIFEGGIGIGQFTNNKDNLQWFINQYEPMFMNDFIGEDKYTQLKQDIVSEDTDVKEKAEKLWNLCKYPCAIFIWCNYVNEDQESQSGSGNIKMDNVNSYVSDSSGKIVRKWNEMVQITNSASSQLLSDFGIRSGKFKYNNVFI